MKARLIGLKHGLELALGDEFGERLVIRAPNILMDLLVPVEMTVNDGVPEGEEVVENVGVNGIAGRECAGHVSAGALVRQDPEVEFGEEAGEVGEGDGGWGREGFDPERGAYLNWVLFEE